MITPRAQELIDSIEEVSVRDMVEEVRGSLPPSRYTRANDMRQYQGLKYGNRGIWNDMNP